MRGEPDNDKSPARGTRSTGLRFIVAALVILCLGYVAVLSAGGAALALVLDSDAVRSAGLRESEGWLLKRTLRRLPLSSREVSQLHLERVWELCFDSPFAYEATSVLGRIDQRQGLPTPLIERIEAHLHADGGSPRIMELVANLTKRRPLSATTEARILEIALDSSSGIGLPALRALGSIGSQRPLSSETVRALFDMADHGKRHARNTALGTLATAAVHITLTPERRQQLIEDYEGSKETAHRQIILSLFVARKNEAVSRRLLRAAGNPPPPRNLIDQYLDLFSDKPAELHDIVRDTQLPASARSNALSRAFFLATSQPIEPLLLWAIGEEASMLRLAAFQLIDRHIERSDAAPTNALLDALHDGLHDSAPRVREAVIASMLSSKLPAVASNRLLLPVLSGDDAATQAFVLRYLVRRKGPTAEVDEAVSVLRQSADANVAAQAAQAWAFRVAPSAQGRRASSDWQSAAFVSLFIAPPALICLGFATYFLARLLVYARHRSSRAFVAGGALAIWIALSLALTWAMVIAALGLGHGARMSSDESATVFAVFFGAIVVYAGVGWLMRLPLRA